MPTVNNATLTLTTVNQNTTIRVVYFPGFTESETKLLAAGVTFHQHIEVIGIDPSGSTTGTVLTTFPNTGIVPLLIPPFSIPIVAEKTVSRASLQEDAGLGDNDEIRCKIRIHTVGLPPE